MKKLILLFLLPLGALAQNPTMPGVGLVFGSSNNRTTITNIAALRALSVGQFITGSVIFVQGYYLPGDIGGGYFVYNSSSSTADNGGTIIAPNVGSGRYARFYNGAISVAWFGAVGDGVTNDTAAINAATLFASTTPNPSVVAFQPGLTYVIKRQNSSSQTGGVLVYAGVSLEGNNCELLLQDNCSFIANSPNQTITSTITANVAANDTTLTVNSTTGLTAGDNVGIRLGDDPTDSPEPISVYFAHVLTINSPTSVTLDNGAPIAITVGSVSAPNKVIIDFGASNPVYENRYIENFRLIQGSSGNAEEGIDLIWARNIEMANIYAENPGAGAVNLQFCFNCRTDNLRVGASIQQSGQGSKGRVISCSNCLSCVFVNTSAQDCQGDAIFIESYCDNLLFDGFDFTDNWFEANGTTWAKAPIHISNGSVAHFNNCRFTGNGTGIVIFDTGATPSQPSFSDLFIETANKIKYLPLECWTGGKLGIDGYTLYFTNIKTAYVSIPYYNSFAGYQPNIRPPTGYIIGAWYYATSDTGMGTVYINPNSINFVPTVNATRTACISGAYGTDYPGNVSGNRVFAGLYSSTVTPGAILTMEFKYCPYQDNDGLNEASLSSLYIRTGTVTLSSGAATVTDPAVAAGTQITLAMVTPSGTIGVEYVATKTNGVGFTIAGLSTDNSKLQYTEVDPP